MQLKLGDIARGLGAGLEGDPEITISGVAGLREAGPGDISFLANPRYGGDVPGSRASAIIVDSRFTGGFSGALLRVPNPYAAFVSVLKLLRPETRVRPAGIHPTAAVDPAAQVATEAAVGAHAVIEAGARIGAGSVLWPGVYVGRGTVVGRDCELHPRVCLLHDVTLGDRVVIHAGSVLGSDGYGYVSSERGHEKIPQLGSVEVGDDVEIGANVAVDRGTLDATRIGRGTKIDNLVHIAHNVIIGENTLIVAQVGISGSTRVGSWAVIGGQVGVQGHVEIGDGARVGAQAGVTKSVPAGETVSGYPAMNHDRARRLQVYLRRLPALSAEVKRLEERIRELEAARKAEEERIS